MHKGSMAGRFILSVVIMILFWRQKWPAYDLNIYGIQLLMGFYRERVAAINNAPFCVYMTWIPDQKSQEVDR